MEFFAGGTPTREALDAVVPDRPVFLTNRDGHGHWVNTTALELAGIDARHTRPGRRPDRARRPTATPSGTLHEGAGDLVAGCFPTATAERWSRRPADRAGAAVLARHHRLAGRRGRRAVRRLRHPPGVRRRSTPPVRSRRASSGPCGGTASAAASRSPSSVQRAGRARSGGSGRRSVKIMQDGVAENFTAAMLEPYLDGHGCATDNAGPQLRRPGRAPRPRHRARRRAASRCTSTPSATARSARRSTPSRPPAPANGPTDGRHHLAHLQVVHPDDILALRRSSARSPTSSRCGPRTSRRWTSSRSRSSASAARRGSTRSGTCCEPAHGSPPAATGR